MDHGLASAGREVSYERMTYAQDEARPDGLETPLEAMVKAHFSSVWRFLRRLGVPAADADDAAQEVILVAARKLESISPGSERSFLLGTAFHVARRMNMTRVRHGEVGDAGLGELPDADPGPEAVAVQNQERALLDEVLMQMPVDLRAVFVLFELEEQSMVDIARELDIPVGTVASRLRRAREDWKTRIARLARSTGATRRRS
jgi:RNA polymerase sigma-70 factor (ECF subfamily)